MHAIYDVVCGLALYCLGDIPQQNTYIWTFDQLSSAEKNYGEEKHGSMPFTALCNTAKDKPSMVNIFLGGACI